MSSVCHSLTQTSISHLFINLPSITLSVCYLSFYQCICPSIVCLSFICSSVNLFVCQLTVYLSVIYISICLSSVNLSVFLSSICQSISLSVVCLSISLCQSSVYQSFICLSSLCQSFFLSVCHLSINLPSVCLSVIYQSIMMLSHQHFWCTPGFRLTSDLVHLDDVNVVF